MNYVSSIFSKLEKKIDVSQLHLVIFNGISIIIIILINIINKINLYNFNLGA